MSSKYANNVGVKYMYDLRQRADLVVGVTFAKHYVCMCTSLYVYCVPVVRFRYTKKRQRLWIEPVYRNDSGVYACSTTRLECQKWSNTTLIVTGRETI